MRDDKSKQSMKPTPTKYRHLFFDLDHTLWDFDANAKESLAEIYNFFQLESKFVSPFDFFLYYLFKAQRNIMGQV